MQENKTRVCPRCNIEKEYSEYYKDKRTSNGIRSYCISCTKEMASIDSKKNSDKIIKRHKKYRKENPEFALLTGIKQRAKRNNIECTITKEDIIIPDVCPVLGTPLIKGESGFNPNSPSVDRIDNNKGYIPSNIKVISNRANRLKKDASIDEIKAIVNYIKTYGGNI